MTYRRFATAAKAIRFAVEELPADLVPGTILQVGEDRFGHPEIRDLTLWLRPIHRQPCRGILHFSGCNFPLVNSATAICSAAVLMAPTEKRSTERQVEAHARKSLAFPPVL